ncbi:hypothetical protein CC014_09755 [Salmonella enterica]|uniref:Uncharacterized protein n=1 Tax=Salmonella enterica TaxID=28901 RepID=A0A5T5G8I5_SALER|nr:hypothetical protein [Salmonella enterica]EAU7850932.1 hypothetical protein [Salmonella enterica]EBM0546813.1 hypothetical protein [Salmonella enterica]EBN0644969.1 hypothetical protein [Salmonella enterica]ECT9024027.1 hypothetical protein [Salmonella enterica subsp. enterica serovar Miami]
MRGLFPRHLCAANASIFVHAPIRPQTAPVQAGKGKKSVKKIVQNCALLCSRAIHDYRPGLSCIRLHGEQHRQMDR